MPASRGKDLLFKFFSGNLSYARTRILTLNERNNLDFLKIITENRVTLQSLMNQT